MLNRAKQILLRKAPESTGNLDAAPEDSGILVNAYCTRAVVPELPFPHRLCARREMPDSQLREHLNGFEGYVISRGPHMTPTKYHVVLHIRRVRQQLSFFAEEKQPEVMAAWAHAANAILFYPDGSVRDPRGRVLVHAAGGDPEAEADVPYPPQAWQRKARTEGILESKGIRLAHHLPPVVSEPELDLRNPVEVATRALALLMVAVRAESLAAGTPMPLTQLRQRCPEALVKLTPRETAFIGQEAPEQSEVVQFAWRYEAVFLLEWALGLAADLPFPEHICDVPKTVQALLATSPADLLEQATLREPTSILDALDLHYRLHWCVRQQRLDRQEPPPGLDGGVISERHHALRWLVRFGDRDWDDVDTPT